MIGQTTVRYRVTEKISAGSMGEVYRATGAKLSQIGRRAVKRSC